MKKIVIIEKSLFFIIRNIENSKNIFFKIVNFYLIAKFNNVIDFYFYKYKILTIIFIVIICNSKYMINYYIIY